MMGSGKPPYGEEFFSCWVRWNWMYTVVRLGSLHVPRLAFFLGQFRWGGGQFEETLFDMPKRLDRKWTSSCVGPIEAIQVRLICCSSLWRLLVILIIMRIHACAHWIEKNIQIKLLMFWHDSITTITFWIPPNEVVESFWMTSMCSCHLTSP